MTTQSKRVVKIINWHFLWLCNIRGSLRIDYFWLQGGGDLKKQKFWLHNIWIMLAILEADAEPRDMRMWTYLGNAGLNTSEWQHLDRTGLLFMVVTFFRNDNSAITHQSLQHCTQCCSYQEYNKVVETES